jgi:hypothetical protein
MAIVISNDLTLGLRGRLGPQIVFRQMNGKTIACHAPRKQDKSKETPLQRQTRTTFREASAWAKQAMLDLEQKAFYTAQARKLQLPNGYTAAIKAYMCERSQLRLSDTRRIQSENCRVEQAKVILARNPTLQDVLQVVEIKDNRFAHAAAHQQHRWRSYFTISRIWEIRRREFNWIELPEQE